VLLASPREAVKSHGGVLQLTSAAGHNQPPTNDRSGVGQLRARRLSTGEASCRVVDDHPVNDIQGALAAGMRAI
jgi:hypothetical protein